MEKGLGFGKGRRIGRPRRAPCGERALIELGDDMWGRAVSDMWRGRRTPLGERVVGPWADSVAGP
jgi:hypothetical protein